MAAADGDAGSANGASLAGASNSGGASTSGGNEELVAANPSSPGGRSLQSADVAWGLAEVGSEGLLDPTVTKRFTFNERVRKEFVGQVLKKSGGVLQYLEAMLPSAANRLEFGDWLMATFPPVDTTRYQDKSPIPSVLEGHEDSQTPMLLHVAFFGLSAAASTRGAPGIDTSSRLLEQFLVDGFVSATEFVIVNHPVELTKFLKCVCQDVMWGVHLVQQNW